MPLADIILRGTDQMSQASQNLADAKSRQQTRKRVALEGVTEAFQGAVKEFKEARSWAEAKRSESDQRDVDNAFSLGLATKGAPGALTALEALRPLTAVGAKRRADLTLKTQDYSAQEIENSLKKAEAHHYTELDTAAAEKRKIDADERVERKKILDSEVPDATWTPEDMEARQLYGAGSYSTKDYRAYRVARAAERKAEAKNVADAAKSKLAAEVRERVEGLNRTSREKEGALNRASREGIADAGNTSREGIATQDRTSRENISKARLETWKTNSENATAARNRATSVQEAYNNARIRLAGDTEGRLRLQASLKGEMQRMAIDRAVVLTKGYRDDEEKDTLLKALDDEKETIDGVLDDLKVMDSAVPEAPAPTKTETPVPTNKVSDQELLDRLRQKGLLK